MSQLQGYVDVSYEQLLEVFGEPDIWFGDKSSVEWVREENGIKFCIYDYKWHSAKNGKIESFHVGGNDIRALELVREKLGIEKS